MPTIPRKKLIEVALPLEAINVASAPRKEPPARTSVHAASVVGAPTARRRPRGDFYFAGG